MKLSQWSWVFLAISVFSLSAHAAPNDDFEPVPGNSGPNAIVVSQTTDPIPPEDLYIRIGYYQKWDGRGGNGTADRAGTPYFQILVPFWKLVAIEFSGMPLESWSISHETQAEWGTPDRSGTSPADISAGVRAYLFAETKYTPDVGFRFMVKSTTGKDRENRRFINAPGYEFDLTLGKTIIELKKYKIPGQNGEPDREIDPEGFVRKLRIFAKLGFLAWQQNTGKQDDAVVYGIAAQLDMPAGFSLNVDLRGIYGYQRGDKPIELAATLTWQTPEFEGIGGLLSGFEFYVGGAIGLNQEAVAYQVFAGIGFHMDVPEGPWKTPPFRIPTGGVFERAPSEPVFEQTLPPGAVTIDRSPRPLAPVPAPAPEPCPHCGALPGQPHLHAPPTPPVYGPVPLPPSGTDSPFPPVSPPR